MRWNFDLFRNRAIICVDDNAFGVTYTHWTRKWESWSFRWDDVVAIDAVRMEMSGKGLVFVTPDNRRRTLRENMENWSHFESAVRRRYPDFSWENFALAKEYVDTNVPCWRRKAG